MVKRNENLTPDTPKNRVANAIRNMLQKWDPESPQAQVQNELEGTDRAMQKMAERALDHLEYQPTDEE